MVGTMTNYNEPKFTKAKQKLIENLFLKNLKDNLGLGKKSEALRLMQSILFDTGIYCKNENEICLKTVELENEDIQNIIDEVMLFVKSAMNESSVCFESIYTKLLDLNVDNEIIPIYLALILREYKGHSVIISNNNELPLNAETLNLINQEPLRYELYIEKWNEKKERYINNLEELFGEFIDSEEKEINKFYCVHKAICRWFFNLAKYSVVTNSEYSKEDNVKLSDNLIGFRNSIKISQNNSRQFLFEKLPEIFKTNDLNFELLSNIIEAKTEIENLTINLEKNLIVDIFEMFGSGKKISLHQCLKEWLKGLNEDRLTLLYPDGENKLFEIIENSSGNTIFNDICKFAVGLPISEWNEDTPDIFIENLKAVKDVIENKEKLSSKIYTILYKNDGKVEVINKFEKADYSENSSLFFNDIKSIVEEYGNGISSGEKRQVLLDMIQKI